jgi:hypothetical protein
VAHRKRRMGMWIAEGVTLEEAIEALFSAYRKEAKR